MRFVVFRWLLSKQRTSATKKNSRFFAAKKERKRMNYLKVKITMIVFSTLVIWKCRIPKHSHIFLMLLRKSYSESMSKQSRFPSLKSCWARHTLRLKWVTRLPLLLELRLFIVIYFFVLLVLSVETQGSNPMQLAKHCNSIVNEIQNNEINEICGSSYLIMSEMAARSTSHRTRALEYAIRSYDIRK